MKTPSLHSTRYMAIFILTAAISNIASANLKILVDFGTSGTYRGADVTNPDANGNYWNGVGYPVAVDMVDVSNNVTSIDLDMTTSYGTDYYNGPSGATQDPAETVYNATALGDLGIDEAVYDFFAGSDSTDGGFIERFEIMGLNSALDYDLTFYGSHKFNSDATTVYSVYADSSYSTLIDSASLDVHEPGSPWLHNQDTTVTISNIPPDVNNKIYVQFVGSGGGSGYLNAMMIADPNQTPVTTNLTINRVSGLPVKVSKSDLASDPDGDSLTFTIGTTTNGSALTQDATYIHVPANTVDDQFTFTVDDSKGGTNSGIVSVLVGSVTPTISILPTASDIDYGNTLAGAILSGGAATNEASDVAVPGTFAFTTPAFVPDAGTYSASITFTPTDTINYTNATATVSVRVHGEIPVVSTPPTAGAISHGQSFADAGLIGGSVVNATNGVPVTGTFTYLSPSTEPDAGTSNAPVLFDPADSGYESITTTVSVAVSKTTPSLTPPSAGILSAGDSLGTTPLNGGIATNLFNSQPITGSFAFENPSLVPTTESTNVNVIFTPADTNNYNAATTSVTVYVAKGVITVFGSSVAKGWNGGGVLTNGSYLNGYAGQMTVLLGAQGWAVTNVSTPGINTDGALIRLPTDVVPTDPDYVLIGLSLGNEGLAGASDPAAVYESFRSGMVSLIADCRAEGYYPVIGLCYPHGNYTLNEYQYVKDMNLLINSWDVPSLNFLGAVDNGVGQWEAGYTTDAAHPNTAGHEEMFYTFVPSLFDAIEAGKSNSPQSIAATGYARLQQDPAEPAPLTFTPSNTMHSFTVSFQVRSAHSGTVASVDVGADFSTIEIRTNGLAYVAANDTEITAGIDADDGQWHEVTLTHHYARQETMFFVDGVQAGSMSEQLAPEQFILGGPGNAIGHPDAPLEADYSKWCIYRAGWNADEAEAQYLGSLQQASMEIYAVLNDPAFSAGAPVTNRAQSLSVAILNSTNAVSVEAPAAPDAPSNLSGQSFSDYAIDLAWTDNSTNETGFVVQRRVGTAGIWSDFVLLAADTTGYVDTNTVTGTIYEYRVAAALAAQRSAYTAAVSVAPSQNGISYREWISQFFVLDSSTYLIDFNTSASPDYGGQIWNTVSNLSSITPLTLVSTNSDASAGYQLSLTDAFDQFRTGNGSPLPEYDDDAQNTLFVSTAASPGKGQLTLSGLDNTFSYDITLFARRVPIVAGFDYRAKYTLQGETAVAFEWDAASNAIPARAFSIRPDATRTITIDVGPADSPSGSIFAGISLMAVKAISPPGSYLIDFNTLSSPSYPAGQTWNTVSSLSDATPYALVNDAGDGSEGYTLALTDGFDQFRSANGSVPDGFSSTPEGTCFALRDDVPLTAQMVFGGLDTNLTYNFTFLARRGSVVGGFDYSGTYTFTGSGTPAELVVDSAYNERYSDAVGIVPDSSGSITLDVSAGPAAGTDFPVLNLIRMTPVGSAAGAGLTGPNDDPESDDLINIVEYAKNLNPLVVDTNAFVLENLELATGSGNLTATYDRYKPAGEVYYTVESTTDLTTNSTWQTDPSVSHTVISDDGTSQVIRIERTPVDQKRFLRLGLWWAP